jgi:AraC-like DNA-binding protein
MDAGERFGAAPAHAGAPGHDHAAAARLTLTLSAEALGALGAYLRSGAARGLPFERALLDALALVPHRRGTGTRAALSQRALRQVHDFIEANLQRDIRVADIARAAFLSPHHLGRSYRRTTGQSLWQYVLQRRAERARRLIEAQPGCTLADIAVQCGFESYSQFIAAFRKTHGMTPGHWRRALESAQKAPDSKSRRTIPQRRPRRPGIDSRCPDQ